MFVYFKKINVGMYLITCEIKYTTFGEVMYENINCIQYYFKMYKVCK